MLNLPVGNLLPHHLPAYAHASIESHSMPAEVLHCPSCGAAAPTDAVRCSYCGAGLAAVACPSCFGLMFAGAKFCSHCGAAVSRTESGGSHQLCPRCRIDMKTVTVGSSTFRECPHCAGLWLDPETLRRICSEQEKQAAVLGMSPPAGDAPNQSIPIRYIPCPVCQKLMNRVNFAHASNVIVDVCRAHGTWFDKDELRRTVEFIRAGGLEKARARHLAEIEEKRRKLASERTAVTTMLLSDNSFPARRSESMLDILRILLDK